MAGFTAVGFGDTSSGLFQRAMSIPGGGRLELGEITNGGDGTGTLKIPTTLRTLMYGTCWADGTKVGVADITNPTTVIANSCAEFTVSETDVSSLNVWFYMMFGW